MIYSTMPPPHSPFHIINMNPVCSSATLHPRPKIGARKDITVGEAKQFELELVSFYIFGLIYIYIYMPTLSAAWISWCSHVSHGVAAQEMILGIGDRAEVEKEEHWI